MGEAKKPWEERWHVDRRGDNIENEHGSTVLILMETPEDGGALCPERAILAAAAPDLYRALAHAVERAVLRCPDLLDKSKPEGVGIMLSGEAFEAAKAALRKARGET